MHRSGFCVGAVSVQVVGECSDDVALVPSLLPFSVETDTSEINLRVEWMPALERTSGRQLFDSDSTWRLCECEEGFQFDFAAPIFGERIIQETVSRRSLHKCDSSDERGVLCGLFFAGRFFGISRGRTPHHASPHAGVGNRVARHGNRACQTARAICLSAILGRGRVRRHACGLLGKKLKF